MLTRLSFVVAILSSLSQLCVLTVDDVEAPMISSIVSGDEFRTSVFQRCFLWYGVDGGGDIRFASRWDLVVEYSLAGAAGSDFGGAVASFLAAFDADDSAGSSDVDAGRRSLRRPAFVVCLVAKSGDSIGVSRGIGGPKSL